MRLAGKSPLLHQIERPALNRWATSLLHEGLATGTVVRVLASHRLYWRFMQSVGAVADDRNPFDRLDLARQARREGAREKRRPFAPEDVVKLWRAAQAGGDNRLADLIWIAAHTGARIEELCSLRVEHVKPDRFDIVAAKTSAGVRTVPVHTMLAPTLARLVEASSDGYVISGEKPDQYGRRGGRLGKRFSALRTAEGFGAEVVFHSIRKCCATQWEHAAVAEPVAQDLIGHKRVSLLGRVYSGGSTWEAKREAIEKLSYPSSD